MSTYEYNLNALLKSNPELGKRIKKTKDDYTVKTFPVKIGQGKTCVIKVDDKEWLLHSKDDPRKEARVFVETCVSPTIAKADVMVILGVGMGYYLEALLGKYSGTVKLCIVVENNMQIFKRFLENTKLQTVHNAKPVSIFEQPNIKFVVGVPSDQIYFTLYETINAMGRSFFSSFYFVEHPIQVRFNKGYYKPVCAEISRICFDIRSSYGNDPEDSWFGVDHMLMNLDIITHNPGISKLIGKFKKQPAVIVATGPSLGKNIHLLPKIKGRAILFAADASLKTLLNYDPTITPDIVCSLERNLSTCNHFKQISDDRKRLMEDIWLAACPVVKPQVYEAWKGKNLVVFRDFAHFKWLKLDKGILNTGKSVTNMAFQIAVAMGCDPIILVGQDLAFAPDGNSHVAGADHARDGLKVSELIKQKKQVMGNSGQMLDSLETWVGMLKRFEFDIKKYDGVCINATEGGALIRGSRVMSLSDAMRGFGDIYPRPIKKLNELLILPSQEEIKKDKSTIGEELKKGVEYMNEAIVDLEDVLKTVEDVFLLIKNDHINKAEVERVLTYCESVKNKVMQHPMCYHSVMHIIQSWCMGRENVFITINEFYKDQELLVEKLIRIFDFFFGMNVLYKKILKGVEANYDLGNVQKM